ncbi:MAG: hypothetical protein U0746_14045 [Gemmataceae bacterium]
MASLRRWLTDMPRTAVACALIAGSVYAQEPDLLDQTKRLQEVAAQQAEAETKLMMSEAVRLSVTDKPKAIEQYKLVLRKLEADKAMPEDKRSSLIRTVKDRIKAAEASAVADVEEAAAKKAREAREAAQKAADLKAAEEAKKIKTALQTVADLRKEGKYAEAARYGKDLLHDYPTNTAVQVLNGISTAFANADEAKAIQSEAEQRRVAVAADLDRSAIPASENVEFPKDWKEKSAKRLKPTLSPAEMRLMQTLNSPLPAEFKAARLQDAIDYLSNKTGQAIFLDKAMLDEAGTSYDTPVTFNARTPVTMRTILRSVLSQANLTYVVREGTVQVTTPQRAKDMMVTKAYYVGDLIGAAGLPFGSQPLAPGGDSAQMNLQVAMIMEMIRTSIDPLSWNGQGGTGSIGYNIQTMSLVIRQSAEVHAMIRNGMGR